MPVLRAAVGRMVNCAGGGVGTCAGAVVVPASGLAAAGAGLQQEEGGKTGRGQQVRMHFAGKVQAVAGATTHLMSLSETVMRTGTASGWARRAEESRSWPAVREMDGCRDSRGTEAYRERQVGLV